MFAGEQVDATRFTLGAAPLTSRTARTPFDAAEASLGANLPDPGTASTLSRVGGGAATCFVGPAALPGATGAAGLALIYARAAHARFAHVTRLATFAGSAAGWW